MSERKYSVSELDALRAAVEQKIFGGIAFWSDSSFAQDERAKRIATVEAVTRTHMLAGHTAHDLWSAMKTKQDVSA